MIKLSIFHNDVIENNIKIPVYEFNTIYRINILGGKSGSGKSLFFSKLLKALAKQDDWSIECDKQIIIINNITNFKKELKENTETLFICDEEMTQSLLKENLSGLISKSKNYFLFIDRGFNAFIDTNVKALFTIKDTGKIYEGIEIYNIQNYIKTL